MGKYGLSAAAVGVLAFVIGFFGFLEILVLVVAFSVMAEKSKWLTRQTLQALYLRIVYSISIIVISWIFGGFQFILRTAKAWSAVTVLANIQSFINGALYIALFVFVLMAVLKLLKGQSAEVPGINKLVDLTIGLEVPVLKQTQDESVRQQPSSQPLQQSATQQPTPQQTTQQPTQQPASQQQKVEPMPVEQKDVQVSTSAPSAAWKCQCGGTNTAKFCIQCGSPRPNTN